MTETGNLDHTSEARIPEPRYAYYRRCQIFIRNGVQCKAPAEKGQDICHNHAGQIDRARRREQERQWVFDRTAELMRASGPPGFQPAGIFTNRTALQKAIWVAAQALLRGEIEAKTAGRL